MLLVAVATDAFSGEFIHMSELPEEVFLKARKAGGLLGERLHILSTALLDQTRREEFEDLKVAQAMHIYDRYRLAVPFVREVPDGVPEGL